MEANPYPHNFRWQIQPNKKKGRTKHAETVDIPSDDFTLEQDHSVLQYAPQTEADYGVALCWAENSVGVQSEPCKFTIVKESEPDPLKNCRAVNTTWEVIANLRAGGRKS